MVPAAIKKSDLIRLRVRQSFLQPALQSGEHRVSVRVKDVLRLMANDDFPASRTPLICQVLTGNKILEENGLTIERIEGPPSKQSPTVVVHYKVNQNGTAHSGESSPAECEETAEEWAERVTSGLCGLLKDEIASLGGTEAFMKWVRSEDEDER
jgi:hypothetical protein